MLENNGYFSKQLLIYANKYHDCHISIIVDRMPLSANDYRVLKKMFPKSHVIEICKVCKRFEIDFFEITNDLFEVFPLCLILETSANRLDYLKDLLLLRGISKQHILTGVSEYRKRMPISELLKRQHFNTDQYTEFTFSRYAIIIRLLFVESYLKKNFDYYNLYQKYLDSKGYGPIDYFIKKFEELIVSISEKGFVNYWIATDSEGRIIDGSHRLAIGIFFNIESCEVRFMNSMEYLYSDIDWLRANFSDAEKQTVVNKYYEIIRKYTVTNL